MCFTIFYIEKTPFYAIFPSFFRHYRPGKCVLRESFHFLFLLKINPEMKCNNVLDRKETFFDYI